MVEVGTLKRNTLYFVLGMGIIVSTTYEHHVKYSRRFPLRRQVRKALQSLSMPRAIWIA